MAKKLSKKARKRWTATGIGVSALVGLYFYQPQRIDFFPKPAPINNPHIDPDQSRLFEPGTRVAVIAAHPDDTEFFLGGTLTRLAQSGAKILLIVCTDGDKGYYPWFMTNASENRRIRRIEQVEAANTYGAEVVFLARPDGRLRADPDLVNEIHDELLKFDPEYLLAFDPIYPPRIQHSDHLQSGVAAEEAAHGLHNLRWILRYSTHAPNFWIDITQEWPQKEQVLMMHASQFGGKHLVGIENMLHGWAEQEGLKSGFGLAEAFRVKKVES